MENKKIIISTIVALCILGLGFLGFKTLSVKKEKKIEPIKKIVSGVFVETVKNTIRPISLKTNGSLVAKNKIDVFSEVQGVFQSSDHLFKPGVAYKKGEVLIQLNSDEFRANLQIQKSNLYQKLVSILPDLKLDYPLYFDKWATYTNAFDINRTTQKLPKFEDSQEKFFITGKGIPTAYYSVKNLQEKLSKYTIYAPFYGILSQVAVNKGALIRPGQKIASFLNPNTYELEVNVSPSAAKFIHIGKSIPLSSLDGQMHWQGKVTRANPIMNTQSQSLTYFVQVSGKNLHEGMYLEAQLEGQYNKPVYEINRSLLLDDNSIYIVEKDSVLRTKSINIIHLNEKTAFVEGLEDGTIVLSQPLPGAYDGKIVKFIKY